MSVCMALQKTPKLLDNCTLFHFPLERPIGVYCSCSLLRFIFSFTSQTVVASSLLTRALPGITCTWMSSWPILVLGILLVIVTIFLPETISRLFHYRLIASQGSVSQPPPNAGASSAPYLAGQFSKDPERERHVKLLFFGKFRFLIYLRDSRGKARSFLDKSRWPPRRPVLAHWFDSKRPLMRI